MRKILKIGYEGRVVIPKKDRIAMNLEQGGFVSVEFEEVTIQRVNDTLEDSNEK